MTIPGSRVSGTAEVLIDYTKCSACGACVEVCGGFPLYMENGRLEVDQTRGFGCIACGACIAVCPTDAIRVSGRDLLPEDVFNIPPSASRADYKQLNALMLARRSTRVFKSREVEVETIQKILAAASTAPVGIPPTEVGVCVFQTRKAVEELRGCLISEIGKWRKMFSPLILTLMRPFIGKENAAMFRDFMAPALEIYTSGGQGGKDLFFYNAPLAMYFYGTPYTDPADPVIPATYAMLAGEALGLGTCILGFPGYIFKYSRKARQKYHLPEKIQPGLMVIFGYPVYRYRKSLRRTFREVNTYS